MAKTEEQVHPINTSDWSKVHGPGAELAKPGNVSVDEVTSWLTSNTLIPGVDFLIIDVRRSDCETIIPTAVNLPAHSLPATLPSLLPWLSAVPKIALHCNSSKGRGTKSAGWLADGLAKYYTTKQGSTPDQVASRVEKQVLILTGGIIAWTEKHGQGSIEERGQPWDGNKLSTIQL